MRRAAVAGPLQLTFAFALLACGQREGQQPAARDGAARGRPTAESSSADTPQAMAPHEPFRTIGRTATTAEIRAWDIDVNGAGKGLPPGRGTYPRGAQVFAQACASCHGVNGEGLSTNPRLIGTEPSNFSFGRDPKLVKTIGNYWPHATTLYDYINRAMPFNTPGSLSPTDVYSAIAYLLAENKVIDRGQVIDARTLPRVRMPARDRFVVDDRKGGPSFR